ncbi:MAG: lasso peptide biosynthesis B2 protein [Candidatus Accumulibacter sp.]|uniref:Lasso peptide biosynthesis B2 protein n=1 Tax=Candidatus Accumulibacter affinis TaxID=2954384 RepID=A0A935W3Z1_9PROT|nr:lasso peptide biosynthesis B2 protein [Candidatus Accumulibacter affinis]
MPSLISRLKKYTALHREQRRVVLATLLFLPLFWAGLRVLGFSRFRAWLARRPLAASGQCPAHAEAAATGELVNRAARHALGPVTCLTRSMWLCCWLRTRGVVSELRIGVRLVHGRLDAHAWVEHAGRPINDVQEVAEHFAVFDESLSPGSFSAP